MILKICRVLFKNIKCAKIEPFRFLRILNSGELQ